MRTIWNGSLSFGLVSIPVGLAVAQQRQDVSFRTLHRECGTPIKQKRYCPFHERDVEAIKRPRGFDPFGCEDVGIDALGEDRQSSHDRKVRVTADRFHAPPKGAQRVEVDDLNPDDARDAESDSEKAQKEETPARSKVGARRAQEITDHAGSSFPP